MKTAKLITGVAGRAAGTTATIVHGGERTYLLEDAAGQFTASRAAVETVEDRPFAETGASPARIEEPVERREVPEPVEEVARHMYDTYCEAVGGKAFNGDDLPKSDEFFEDPSKQKQANAWRAVAGEFLDEGEDEPDAPEEKGSFAKVIDKETTPATDEPAKDADIHFDASDKGSTFADPKATVPAATDEPVQAVKTTDKATPVKKVEKDDSKIDTPPVKSKSSGGNDHSGR